jgi:hypothetical protein
MLPYQFFFFLVFNVSKKRAAVQSYVQKRYATNLSTLTLYSQVETICTTSFTSQ